MKRIGITKHPNFPIDDWSRITVNLEDLFETPIDYTPEEVAFAKEFMELVQIDTDDDEGLDQVDIDRAGEYVVFTKAWDYIKKVNPEDKKHQEALYHFSDIHLKIALELAINYFQEQEEYEKCAHLKKNLEFVKLLLI